MDPKFGRNIAFHNVSDKLEGHGHRSQVKCRYFEKRDFPTFSYGVTYVDVQGHFVMTLDIM